MKPSIHPVGRPSMNPQSQGNALLDKPAVRAALAMLVEGHDFATDLGVPRANYAVSVANLRAVGCSDNLVR